MLTIARRPSPHHSARPAGVEISAIVLHCDAGKSAAGTISWLDNPASRVSYHYLVGRLGHVYQFVDESRKAWHAGESTFQGVPSCNNYSVGVAFANRNDGEPYSSMQVEATAELCAEIIRRHPAITLDRVTMHKVVSPGRKSDPAPPFDFAYFLARVSHYFALEPGD